MMINVNINPRRLKFKRIFGPENQKVSRRRSIWKREQSTRAEAIAGVSRMAEDELDWEEWDGVAPFWQHMVAGSCAGVIEHTCMFPVDTLKTHVQCADCPQRQC